MSSPGVLREESSPRYDLSSGPERRVIEALTPLLSSCGNGHNEAMTPSPAPRGLRRTLMTVLPFMTVLRLMTVLTVYDSLDRNVEQGRLEEEKRRGLIAS